MGTLANSEDTDEILHNVAGIMHQSFVSMAPPPTGIAVE